MCLLNENLLHNSGENYYNNCYNETNKQNKSLHYTHNYKKLLAGSMWGQLDCEIQNDINCKNA